MGLSSKTMALITSAFDAMSINERQMALTTSGLCALQLAESIKSGTGFEPWVFYYP